MIRYRRQLYRYGEAAEVYIYPVKETGRKGPRGKRRKPSKTCQARLNNLHRTARLTREIGANFGEGDIFITLTYKQQPGDYQRATKDIKNYFDRIKRAMKRAGLAGEFKAVWVSEQGSRSGRWHHHAIITGGLPWEELSRLWALGRVEISGLYETDTGRFDGLAGYMCKSSGAAAPADEDEDEQDGAAGKMQGGRIHRTKNIITPEPLENDFEISRRKAGRIAKELMQGDDAGEVLPKLAGYRVTETGTFYNDIDGHYYIKILLKKAKKAKQKTGGGAKSVQVQRGAGKPNKSRSGGTKKAKKQQADS